MIENQKMPRGEILEILGREGSLEELRIDSSPCMSEFDLLIVAASRGAVASQRA